MLSYVPYTFDLYAGLPRYLRDSAARMVSFANHDGRFWFSVRTFGRIAGLSKSTAARHLHELTSEAHRFATRRPHPGGGYEYTVNRRFLALGAVSHGRAPGVPRVPPKEKAGKKTAFAQRDSDRKPVEAGALPATNWEPRLRSWRKSRFWQPYWGPKPNEPGCWAPEAAGKISASEILLREGLAGR